MHNTQHDVQAVLAYYWRLSVSFTSNCDQAETFTLNVCVRGLLLTCTHPLHGDTLMELPPLVAPYSSSV